MDYINTSISKFRLTMFGSLDKTSYLYDIIIGIQLNSGNDLSVAIVSEKVLSAYNLRIKVGRYG